MHGSFATECAARAVLGKSPPPSSGANGPERSDGASERHARGFLLPGSCLGRTIPLLWKGASWADPLKEWTREIAVTPGSNLTLAASMERLP